MITYTPFQPAEYGASPDQTLEVHLCERCTFAYAIQCYDCSAPICTTLGPPLCEDQNHRCTLCERIYNAIKDENEEIIIEEAECSTPYTTGTDISNFTFTGSTSIDPGEITLVNSVADATQGWVRATRDPYPPIAPMPVEGEVIEEAGTIEQ